MLVRGLWVRVLQLRWSFQSSTSLCNCKILKIKLLCDREASIRTFTSIGSSGRTLVSVTVWLRRIWLIQRRVADANQQSRKRTYRQPKLHSLTCLMWKVQIIRWRLRAWWSQWCRTSKWLAIMWPTCHQARRSFRITFKVKRVETHRFLIIKLLKH